MKSCRLFISYIIIPSAYLKRSYALTNTSSLPMARMASQFKNDGKPTADTQSMKEKNVIDSSFNIKIKSDQCGIIPDQQNGAENSQTDLQHAFF